MPSIRSFPILSVDDNPEVADLLRRAAVSAFPNAQIASIHSASEFNAYLNNPQTTLPRLILLDLNLSNGIEGFDMLAQLRASSATSLIPVIILSASDNKSHVQEAYGQGANAYMSKPESYTDWMRFMELLKSFWQQTATLPR